MAEALRESIRAEFNQLLQTTVSNFRVEITRLEAELRAARTPSTRPKPSLPDTKQFAGKQYNWDTWNTSIKAKLRVDGELIGNTEAQFWYVYEALESHVQATILPLCQEAEDSDNWDYKQILGHLARIYDNLNKVQEAEDRLGNISQGSDSLSIYVSKFERLLWEAKSNDISDKAKISYFRYRLSDSLRKALSGQLNLPREYTAFVATCQQLAGSSGRYSAGFPTSGHSTSRPTSPSPGFQRNPRPATPAFHRSDAMDLSAMTL